MYALIQYAKQRHGTTDLSGVSIGNIFMKNNTLRKSHKTSYEQLKKSFPYPYDRKTDEEPEYQVTGADFGKAGMINQSSIKTEEAASVVETVVKRVEEQK